MTKTPIFRIFIGFSICSVILVILAFTIPQNIIYDAADPEVSSYKPEAVSTEYISETAVRLTYDVSDRPYGFESLLVYSVHTDFEVYAGDTLLYSLVNGESPWMSTTGAYYNFIYLPAEITEVKITVDPEYPEIETAGVTVYVANGSHKAFDLARDSSFKAVSAILDLFLGICILVFYGVLKINNKPNPSLMYLGAFTVSLGVWAVSETALVTQLTENSAAISFMAFISLLSICVPFIQFTKYYFKVMTRASDIMTVAVLFLQAVLVILHITGAVAFRRSVMFIHTLIIVSAAFHMSCFMRFAATAKDKLKVRLYSVAIVILLLASAVDLFVYYAGISLNFSAARLGLFVYILILAVDSGRQILREFQEARDAELIRVLAYKDNLTGLLNRNSYMEWINSVTTPDGVAIINIDLNDLKKTNDTMGHLIGDKYLKDSAGIILDVFNDKGSCYRIGGDEFVVVLNKGTTESEIKAELEELDNAQLEYNLKSDDLKISMAYGFAIYDNATDKSIEALSVRADNAMYEHKRLIKSNRFATA